MIVWQKRNDGLINGYTNYENILHIIGIKTFLLSRKLLVNRREKKSIITDPISWEKKKKKEIWQQQ